MYRVLLVDDIEIFRRELTQIIDRMDNRIDNISNTVNEKDYIELKNLVRRLSDEICAGITVNLYNAAEVEKYANELSQYSADATKTGIELLKKILEEKRVDESGGRYAAKMVLSKVRERVVASLPWLGLYYDLEDLFSIYDNENEIDYCERLSEHINRFHFDCKSELIKSVCDYILNHINDGISLETASQAMFVNKTYLSHIFKVETGTTFVDYITRVKMQRAKHLLLTSDVKIYELAHNLGFEDVEYFGKLFKKYIGTSASIYRMRA